MLLQITHHAFSIEETQRIFIFLLIVVLICLFIRLFKEDYEPIRVLIDAKPYMLMEKFGELTPEERDIKRAEYVREHFKMKI